MQKLDKPKIVDFATTFKSNWSFNPPCVPHMGGAWERLVRSVKEVLYGLIKDHVLTDAQLATVLTEAESVVNSRPLAHISDDPSDLDALTPNHILLGKHRNWSSIIGTDIDNINSRKKYKQVQALSAAFRSRWTKEYLPTLTTRNKWKRRRPTLTSSFYFKTTI